MQNELDELIACPRCDKSPLETLADGYRCKACKVDFPALDGIPWLFAEPDAAFGEWRNRLQMALTKIAHDASGVEQELRNKSLPTLTRERLERYRDALADHRKRLQSLLEPLAVRSTNTDYSTYLALRTRLPVDQGLNTYYANIHRDWSWGDEENEASLEQLRSVLHDGAALGRVLVLGAGAARLAYDIHMQLDARATIALDFNPMLLLVAKQVTRGNELELYEFPIAPRSAGDDAVLRTLCAPEKVRDGFELVLGDALRPPFAAGSFDTVVTPWLIDIISEDLSVFAARINRLLKPEGRWINFGSLAFASNAVARRYSPGEVNEIVAASGFSEPCVSEATIPYMCSPASRHGRQEHVFTFAAIREREAKSPARHRALPDWIVTGREPVPQTPEFRNQAMTTQIYSFLMQLIDGKRSIEDMAAVMEKQRLMTRAEAVPAIRSFLTKMHDDAEQS